MKTHSLVEILHSLRCIHADNYLYCFANFHAAGTPMQRRSHCFAVYIYTGNELMQYGMKLMQKMQFSLFNFYSSQGLYRNYILVTLEIPAQPHLAYIVPRTDIIGQSHGNVIGTLGIFTSDINEQMSLTHACCYSKQHVYLLLWLT